MSNLNDRDRPTPAPLGEALPETAEVRDTRRKLAALLALGAVRAARRRGATAHGAPTAAGALLERAKDGAR